MRYIFIVLFLLQTFVIVSPHSALAHPGNTASDGCHYCRTNCSKWGEVEDARHCHGGNTAPAVQEPVRAVPTALPTAKPTSTTRPTVKPTATPTPLPSPTPSATPSPSPTAEPTVSPSPEATLPETTAEPESQDNETVESTPALSQKPRGFWGWVWSLWF